MTIQITWVTEGWDPLESSIGSEEHWILNFGISAGWYLVLLVDTVHTDSVLLDVFVLIRVPLDVNR